MEVQVLSDDQVYARLLKGWKAIPVQPQAQSEEGGGEEGGEEGQEGVEQEAEAEEQTHKKEEGTEGMKQLMLSLKENVF